MTEVMPDTESDAEVMVEESCGAVTPEALDARVEALLLVAERPLTEARIADILELASTDSDDGEGDETDDEAEAPASTLSPVQQVRGSIGRLNAGYEQTARAFRIVQVAGGHQVMTQPEHGELLARLRGDRQMSRLTPAALETLAIIAYRQPVLRADLEAIRGVACGEVLRGLLDRRLVRIVGRAEELGRPMLYGTTKEFLQTFGLGSLKDLPKSEDL
jgi:segregation and condensation protein B